MLVLPLVVFVCPIVVLACLLVALACLLVALVRPLVELFCPLVVSVCPLVVLVVLSVSLFITDLQNTGVIKFRSFINRLLTVQSKFINLCIVTRNNIVWKLARGYCLCYCKTFLLVPDSTECIKFVFTKECSTLFVLPKIK